MKLGDGLNMDIFTLGSLWQLKVGVNGYEKLHGNGLVTQAVAGIRNQDAVELATKLVW